MADKVTGTARSSVSFNHIPDTGFLANQPLNLEMILAAVFKASGVTADQVDKIHAKTYSFTASTSQTINLQSLLDIEGGTFSLARVRVLAIRVKSTTDGAYLSVEPDATNGWDNSLLLPGGFRVLAKTTTNDGFVVFVAPNTTGYEVDASNRVILLTPSAHAFDVDVVIAGCST